VQVTIKYYAVLHKGLELPNSHRWLYTGIPVTNPLWIQKDDSIAQSINDPFLFFFTDMHSGI
jgi:hypothetical protein